MTKRRLGVSLRPPTMDDPSPLHNLPAAPEPATPAAPDDAPESTPEEQMARFEEALKEEDWGHQPC